MQIELNELAMAIKAINLIASKIIITGVSTDSRTIKPGECFFAIKGPNFDGHDYISEVFNSGASCAVIDNPDKVSGNILNTKCILKVKDTIKTLGELAAYYRKKCGFKVIAITGSAGKTTTREIVYHVLKNHFDCIAAKKSFNNEIGLPLTILGTACNTEIVILELGSNGIGQIRNLTKIAQPDIALITNIHPAHLEGFGSLSAIIKEKVSIAEGLNSASIFLVNGDFPELIEYCRTIKSDFTAFGTSDNCTIRGANIHTNGLSGSFDIGDIRISIPLPGKGNIENALAAWAICSNLSISPADFGKAMENFEPVAMRMEFLNFPQIKILNDCYNANPASMKNALDTLQTLANHLRQRAVFICGDMLELGSESRYLHSELGIYAAKSGVKLLIACGEFAEITAEAAKKTNNMDVCLYSDSAGICDNLTNFIKPNDIILVKGSRAAGMEIVTERLKELFSRPAVPVR